MTEDNLNSELEAAREQQRLNIPAKRLLEKLEPIPSNIEDLQRRWFWELLQNASDYNDSVDVTLELFTDRVIFRHNGNPFRPIDTENLIAPDSGKDTDSGTSNMIGKFGTGFITTHILSARILVQGIIKSEIVENYYSEFKLMLDRSGYNNREALKESIRESTVGLNKNNHKVDYDSTRFNTSFCYYLDTPLPNINPQNVVTKGLEYVSDVLPYTLAFMPKVQSVTIINNGTKFIDTQLRNFSASVRSDDRVLISVKDGESQPKNVELRIFKEKDSQIIVGVVNNRLVPYPKNITKLFCSLPMIGTEEFGFPVIVNAKTFTPKTERDGINISANDHQNRNILIDAVTAFKKLLETISRESISECHSLIKIAFEAFKSDEEKNWFKINITDKLKDQLLEASIVETTSGRIALKNALIPFLSKGELKDHEYKSLLEDLYQISSGLHANLVPVHNQYYDWFNAIDFNLFPKSKFTMEMLLSEVRDFGNLDTLSGKVTNHIDWLNQLLAFTLKYDPILLDKFSVIPNQLGKFLLRKDDINWDEGIDQELFDIHELIRSTDYRSILLHKQFESNVNLLKKENSKSNKTISKTIDDAFSEYDDRQSPKFLSALRLTFKWFNDSELPQETLKDLFKWFSSHRPQLFLETFDDEKRDQAFVIVQSGKLESLAKLAESNITSKDIDEITKNFSQIMEFVEITNELGGMSEILDHAKELLSEKRHFEYLKSIGEEVERVFKDAINEEDIDADIIHKGWGSHDFEIKNKKNGKSVFIELKSFAHGATEPIKLAISQAKKAFDNPEKFILCLLERPPSNQVSAVDYIKRKLICKKGIKDLLVSSINDNNLLEKILDRPGNVKLLISFREEIRVSISKDLLTTGSHSFSELVVYIKEKLKD